jgi:predicted PurR-regulated permease PerM
MLQDFFITRFFLSLSNLVLVFLNSGKASHSSVGAISFLVVVVVVVVVIVIVIVIVSSLTEILVSFFSYKDLHRKILWQWKISFSLLIEIRFVFENNIKVYITSFPSSTSSHDVILKQ